MPATERCRSRASSVPSALYSDVDDRPQPRTMVGLQCCPPHGHARSAATRLVAIAEKPWRSPSRSATACRRFRSVARTPERATRGRCTTGDGGPRRRTCPAGHDTKQRLTIRSGSNQHPERTRSVFGPFLSVFSLWRELESCLLHYTSMEWSLATASRSLMVIFPMCFVAHILDRVWQSSACAWSMQSPL
jgi:hypothetical protein